MLSSRPENEAVPFEKAEGRSDWLPDRHLGYWDCIFESKINEGRCSVVIWEALDLLWKFVKELERLILSHIEVAREKS